MGKKSKAERQAAARKHQQQADALPTTADKAIVTQVQIAADFLLHQCCPKAVKAETAGIQKTILHQIFSGMAQPQSYQKDKIISAATTLGWTPPNKG